MCNPRRVQVTATRELAEAWEQEVSRTVRLERRVAGEARLRRPLSASLSEPVLRALVDELASGADGWREVEEGYRRDLEGGYLVYHLEDRSLEIVARIEGLVSAEGRASTLLRGTLGGQVEAEGESTVFDDGWQGQDEQWGLEQARDEAEQQIDEEVRRRLDETRRSAASGAAAEVQAQAEAAAQSELGQEAGRHEAQLTREAEQRLTTFQVSAMQAFNRRVAAAYGATLLAYARQQGAEQVQVSDDGQSTTISFLLPR